MNEYKRKILEIAQTNKMISKDGFTTGWIDQKSKELQKREEESAKPTAEDVEEHCKLREAMLEHSRKSMASIIARYL